MKTRTILQKLKSTKLWAAVAGIALGVALALGADADTVQTVTGAVTAVASLVTYIVTEGKVDAESVKTAVIAVQEAVEAMKDDENRESTSVP